MVLLLFFPALYFVLFPGKTIVVSFLCYGIIAYWIFSNIHGFNYHDFDGHRAFYLILAYNLIIFVRGFGNIDEPSDLYVLISNDLFVCFLLPFFIFLADFDFLKALFRYFALIGIPFCAFFYFFPPKDGLLSFGHNISFAILFLFCSPLVNKRFWVFSLVIALCAITQDFNRRSVMVNFAVATLLFLSYRLVRNLMVRRLVFCSSILVPILLLLLGLTGKFNVFSYIEKLDVGIKVSETRNLNVDSRTSIYVDVFGELSAQNRLLVGLGERGKTQTSLVNSAGHDYWRIYKYGRSQTESGMLNFFQYGGFLGFLVYSYLVLTCAFYALFRSKNDFLLLIGAFVSFKYFYSFIEDTLSANVSTACLFLWFGICLNRKMRRLTNKEMSSYLHNAICEIPFYSFRLRLN